MTEEPFDWSKVTLPCPQCGRTMVARVNKANGSRFMSCSGWPDYCQATAPVPAYAVLKAQDASALPGFE